MGTRTIGIPKALLYYRYGVLWKTFFEELGLAVAVSPDTDRAMLEAGDAASIDECCLASKVYCGHVRWLIGACDAVFVPAFASGNPRCGFCTKYQSLPDMVRNAFRDQLAEAGCEVLSLFVPDASKPKKVREAYLGLAASLGATPRIAMRAYKRALQAQRAADGAKAQAQAESLRLIDQLKRVVAAGGDAGVPDIEADRAPMPILVVAHPYVSHDAYVAGEVVRGIEEAGGFVLFADETDHRRACKRSFEFSDTLPWEMNRELVGSILELQGDVAGVVVLSAFPCGPDSLFADALVRGLRDVPILRLVLDAQSGSAGVQTRIESFMDILQYQAKGGYLHG